jgi:hypothetical protein
MQIRHVCDNRGGDCRICIGGDDLLIQRALVDSAPVALLG